MLGMTYPLYESFVLVVLLAVLDPFPTIEAAELAAALAFAYIVPVSNPMAFVAYHHFFVPAPRIHSLSEGELEDVHCDSKEPSSESRAAEDFRPTTRPVLGVKPWALERYANSADKDDQRPKDSPSR
jgi:hypothetical protein